MFHRWPSNRDTFLPSKFCINFCISFDWIHFESKKWRQGYLAFNHISYNYLLFGNSNTAWTCLVNVCLQREKKMTWVSNHCVCLKAPIHYQTRSYDCVWSVQCLWKKGLWMKLMLSIYILIFFSQISEITYRIATPVANDLIQPSRRTESDNGSGF